MLYRSLHEHPDLLLTKLLVYKGSELYLEFITERKRLKFNVYKNLYLAVSKTPGDLRNAVVSSEIQGPSIDLSLWRVLP